MRSPNFFLAHIINRTSTRSGNHRTTTTLYQSTPISYDPPEVGEAEQTFRCAWCLKEIPVIVLSKKKVLWLRLKGLISIAIGVLLGWIFGGLLSKSLTEGIRSIIGLIMIGSILWGLNTLIKSRASLAFKFEQGTSHFIHSKS